MAFYWELTLQKRWRVNRKSQHLPRMILATSDHLDSWTNCGALRPEWGLRTNFALAASLAASCDPAALTPQTNEGTAHQSGWAMVAMWLSQKIGNLKKQIKWWWSSFFANIWSHLAAKNHCFWAPFQHNMGPRHRKASRRARPNSLKSPSINSRCNFCTCCRHCLQAGDFGDGNYEI